MGCLHRQFFGNIRLKHLILTANLGQDSKIASSNCVFSICQHVHIQCDKHIVGRICIHSNVLIVWRSPETCSTNACFRPGLERNAVEHAGDIAEALQEKLSVCLRLDRPNGDRGGVKSTLLGGPFGPWMRRFWLPFVCAISTLPKP